MLLRCGLWERDAGGRRAGQHAEPVRQCRSGEGQKTERGRRERRRAGERRLVEVGRMLSSWTLPTRPRVSTSETGRNALGLERIILHIGATNTPTDLVLSRRFQDRSGHDARNYAPSFPPEGQGVLLPEVCGVCGRPQAGVRLTAMACRWIDRRCLSCTDGSFYRIAPSAIWLFLTLVPSSWRNTGLGKSTRQKQEIFFWVCGVAHCFGNLFPGKNTFFVAKRRFRKKIAGFF